MASSKCLFLLVLMISITTMLVVPYKPLFQDALATPPSFSRQEVLGHSVNWFDMYNGRPVTNGPSHIDIKSVNYFSDGRSLNATIWLADFEPIPPADHDNVNYGMYFDADYNKKTGVQGIDYKVEISWDKKNQTWTRVFEEWGTNGTTAKTLSKEPAENFSENGSSYVTISADLNTMISPEKYKVVFYAEVIDSVERNTWIVDATNWVSIPPPEFILSILPSSVNLRQGDRSTVEVRINSTTNTGLMVKLSPDQVSDRRNGQTDFDLEFELEELPISPYGLAATHLHVNAFPYADVSPHTMTISANSTIPEETLFTRIESEDGSTSNNSVYQRLPSYVTDESTVKQSAFLVEVDEWDMNDQFNEFIDEWFTPLAAVYTTISGIISGIVGWMYGRRQGKNSMKKNNNES
jgi:hypothetical protein